MGTQRTVQLGKKLKDIPSAINFNMKLKIVTYNIHGLNDSKSINYRKKIY